MNPEQLIERLLQVAAFGLRHTHYAHTVNKAKLYRQLVGGVGLDSLLHQFVRRETETLFKQRVALTQHIVTSICDNLLDVFYKVPRSNSARRVLTYAGDDVDNKIATLEGIVEKFWGDKSFDDYLSDRYIKNNSLDPNGFTVVEWDAFDSDRELIAPRPFEVSSAMAVDYTKTNNVLDYLIVQGVHYYLPHELSDLGITPEFTNPNKKKVKGQKFTLYSKNQTFQLLQVDDKVVLDTRVAAQEGKRFKKGDKQYVKLGEKFYEFKVFKPHNLGYVNAWQTGYLADPATNGETYVNQLHRIEPFLLKTIKVNSEFDLVATLLAMPQLMKYGQPCTDEGCYLGELKDGSACGSCGGTGIKSTAMSAQDSITITMPDSREEMIPLKDLMHYVHPPVEIIQWQEEYIDNLTEKCKVFLHNSDTFTKKEISETATGKNLDVQNVYDTLYPFAIVYGKTWGFGINCIADLADRGKDLVASLKFGKDFKLKSLDTLILDLSVANKLGHPSLVRHLNEDIAQIIFFDKPSELMRYKVKEMFNPFSGKGEKEIMLLMNSSHVREEEKILYANMSLIFDELEIAGGKNGSNFYLLTRSKQREAIYSKVAEIKEAIEAVQPDPETLLG